MNKKTLLLPFVALMLISCNNRPNSCISTEKIEIDSIAYKDSLFKVSFIKEEGIKAIGNINFFISKEEFNKQQKIFKEPLYHTNIIDNGYFLGEYNFTNIEGNFLNDSLLNVHFWGYPIQYEEYAVKMQKQYAALVTILNTKYGLPEYINDLPEWSNISNKEVRLLAEWNLGFKKLVVWVVCIGAKYRLDFAYYVPEMTARKNKIESEEALSSNKKAAEIL